MTLDEQGRYSVLLGASTTGGLPADMFAAGAVRWIGVRVAEEGAAENRRVRLVSVPYALSAADAQTFAGRPVTDFVLTRAAQGATVDSSAPGDNPMATISNGSTNGIPDRVARFDGVSTIVPSGLIFDNGSNIGIGTTTPTALFHVNAVAGDAFNLYTTTTAGGSVAVYANHSGAASIGYAGFFTKSGAGGTNIGLYAEATGGGVNYAAIFQGNVGIGTGAPSSRLQVNAAAADAINAYTTSTGGGSSAVFASHSGNAPIGYAGFFSKTGSGTTNIGIQATASGATNNYAGIFSAGNVGIGTTAPGSRLEVVDSVTTQTAKFVQNAAGVGSSFSVASPPPTAIRGDATSSTGVTTGVLGVSSAISGLGVAGENLASSGKNAGVYGVALSTTGAGVWGVANSSTDDAVGVFGTSASVTGTGVFGEALASSGDAVGVAGVSRAANGTGVLGEVTNASGENYGISGRVIGSTTAGSTAGMFINTNTNAATGSLLLGRTSTGAGQANVFRVDTAGKGFFNGGTQTSGADFAESVSVKEDKSEYQPGDVIAIDTTGTRRFTKVAMPYSTLVAGIYSTKPGVLATLHPTGDPRIEAEIPLAVVGIVPCKVTNENGVIKAGDLLVASSREGYAMKGTDTKRMNGAVIGKALQDMNGTTGVIEVLVSLQ